MCFRCAPYRKLWPAENLLLGDLVLADRVFTVHGSVGLYCAQLKIPEFTRGKSQLGQKSVDEAREIDAVRIHARYFAN